MANWTILKTAIANVIKTNGNQEITGQLLQNVLNSIVNSIGENATFAGIATTTTNPGTPDGPVFYIATEAGIYSNFSGITINIDEAALLVWKDGDTWEKEVSGFASSSYLMNEVARLDEKLSELGQEIETHHPQTNEKGFHVIDPHGNIGMQYTEEGLDFAKISQHAVEVLKGSNIEGTSPIVQTQEEGFFVVDDSLNIGMSVDNDGVHAKNILEFEIVQS